MSSADLRDGTGTSWMTSTWLCFGLSWGLAIIQIYIYFFLYSPILNKFLVWHLFCLWFQMSSLQDWPDLKAGLGRHGRRPKPKEEFSIRGLASKTTRLCRRAWRAEVAKAVAFYSTPTQVGHQVEGQRLKSQRGSRVLERIEAKVFIINIYFLFSWMVEGWRIFQQSPLAPFYIEPKEHKCKYKVPST